MRYPKMKWEELTAEQQIRIFWTAGIEDDTISFDEFDEMMQGFVIYEAHNTEGV